MELKSRKGLIVAYVEGLFVVGLLFLAATYKQIDFNFYRIIILALICPIAFTVFNGLFSKNYRTTVSFVGASMGSFTFYGIYHETIGMVAAIPIAFLFLLFFWFCFDEINKIYFIKKP